MTVQEIESEIKRQDDDSPTDWDLQRGVWEIALQVARIAEAVSRKE